MYKLITDQAGQSGRDNPLFGAPYNNPVYIVNIYCPRRQEIAQSPELKTLGTRRREIVSLYLQGPVNTTLDVAVAPESTPIKARGVSLVVLKERRATPSGVFSAATHTLYIELLGLWPFFHPTALKLATLEPPKKRLERFLAPAPKGGGIGICRTNHARFALLAEKMANSSDTQSCVNGL